MFQFELKPRKFLLGTFKEVVILWQRLRVEAWDLAYGSPQQMLLSSNVAVQQGQSGFTKCWSLRATRFCAWDSILQSSTYHDSEGSYSEAWVLDDHRFSLRLLLGTFEGFSRLGRKFRDDEHFKSWKGAHLMEISRLEGLTTQVYAEARHFKIQRSMDFGWSFRWRRCKMLQGCATGAPQFGPCLWRCCWPGTF